MPACVLPATKIYGERDSFRPGRQTERENRAGGQQQEAVLGPWPGRGGVCGVGEGVAKVRRV